MICSDSACKLVRKTQVGNGQMQLYNSTQAGNGQMQLYNSTVKSIKEIFVFFIFPLLMLLTVAKFCLIMIDPKLNASCYVNILIYPKGNASC